MDEQVFHFTSSPGMAKSWVNTSVQTEVALRTADLQVIAARGKKQEILRIPWTEIRSVRVAPWLNVQYILFAAMAAVFAVWQHWAFFLFVPALLWRGLNFRLLLEWTDNRSLVVYSMRKSTADACAAALEQRLAEKTQLDGNRA